MAVFDSKSNVDHFAKSVPFEQVVANGLQPVGQQLCRSRGHPRSGGYWPAQCRAETTVARIDQLRKDIDAIGRD